MVYLATLKGMEEAAARLHLGDWLKQLDLYDYRQQILLSLGVLALTTYGMLAIAAHVLRPEAMLSEAPWAFLIRKRPHER